MKQWKCFLGLGMVLLAVCARADEFKFVSILSSPVASFDKVETKACAVTKPKGQFNAGSEESTGGTIYINAPIQVQNVFMDNNTKIITDSSVDANDPISWLVDTLTVGSGGVVYVKKLIANKVTLLDQSEDEKASLKVDTDESSLIIKNEAWATKGTASNSLTVSQRNSDGSFGIWFKFETDGESDGQATWKNIPWGTYEVKDSNNDPDTYYPITTANNN